LLRDEEMVPMHPWYKGFKVNSSFSVLRCLDPILRIQFPKTGSLFALTRQSHTTLTSSAVYRAL
jgi:hypothetical protein